MAALPCAKDFVPIISVLVGAFAVLGKGEKGVVRFEGRSYDFLLLFCFVFGLDLAGQCEKLKTPHTHAHAHTRTHTHTHTHTHAHTHSHTRTHTHAHAHTHTHKASEVFQTVCNSNLLCVTDNSLSCPLLSLHHTSHKTIGMV